MNTINLANSPFRVEDNLAALFRSGLVGAAVEEGIAVAEGVALLAATTEVEAAELLLGLLVVVGQVVGLCVANVDARRAGSAGRHDLRVQVSMAIQMSGWVCRFRSHTTARRPFASFWFFCAILIFL